MKDAPAGAWAIARKDAATAAPSSSSLQHTTTLAPALTNSCAQPLPIPLLPPVTITTFSAYRKPVIFSPPRVAHFAPSSAKHKSTRYHHQTKQAPSILATSDRLVQTLSGININSCSAGGLDRNKPRELPALPPNNVTGKIVLVIGNKIKYDLAVSSSSGLEQDRKALSDAARGD